MFPSYILIFFLDRITNRITSFYFITVWHAFSLHNWENNLIQIVLMVSDKSIIILRLTGKVNRIKQKSQIVCKFFLSSNCCFYHSIVLWRFLQMLFYFDVQIVLKNLRGFSLLSFPNLQKLKARFAKWMLELHP